MSAIGQISFPVRLGDGGHLASVDQAAPEFAGEQAMIVCLTPLGWLPGYPDMGLSGQRFRRGGADLAEVERQIERWVEGADAALEQDPSALDRALALVGVQVSA